MSEFQNTPEWYAARLGKLTASRVGDAMARTKDGWGASRDNYIAELAYERLTGESLPSYATGAMETGTLRQPAAVAAYELRFDVDVEDVGFVPHPTIAMSGASPDGRVGKRGLVEFKCPTLKTHWDTLLGAKVAKKYLLQMMWQLACDPEREWCDYCSFFPSDRLPPNMQLHVTRLRRDDGLIATLESDVLRFLEEVDLKVSALRSAYMLRQTLQDAA